MRSIEKVSGLRCQVSEKPKAKEPKAKSRFMILHSYHSPRYNGLSPREQLGLPFFCAAGNLERRLLAASFASATGSGMDGKLPRLRAGTSDIRYPHTGILQPWLRNRLSASSPTPRLGCSSFFGCPCQPGADHDLFCLRVRPRSDRTWEIDFRLDERGVAQRAAGSACAQTRKLLSPDVSRPAKRRCCLTVYEQRRQSKVNSPTSGTRIDL